MSTKMNTKYIAALAAVLPLAQAGPLASSKLVARDPPAALPACATEGDLLWQPVMDFDTDSCYNAPAVGADGTLSEGLDNCYVGNVDDCRDASDLDNNNVYSRSRCNNGWCAHIYEYYFEKDVALEDVCGVGAGHRHDWEHIVVWVQEGYARYVAASAHGDWDVKKVEDIMMDGTHPKMVYHKDGSSTHAFRFAGSGDDAIENDKGVWFAGALVSWNGFPDAGVRDAMIGKDWGSASIAFSDAKFKGALDGAKGGNDIPLDTGHDDDISPGEPVGC